jgi:hypothetical protein
MHQKYIVQIAIWVFSCLLAGCGSRHPPLGKVHGTVTVNNKSLTQGRICFIPATGRPALGQIGSDGKYELTTYDSGDGAAVGEHRVTIEAVEVVNAPKTMADEFAQAAKRAPAQTLKWLAPERYSQIQSSQLATDVKTGTNQIDFNLSER